MGRTREYDEDAVLTAAMHAFRRKGYLGVSIRDLEAATGIKGGSIYNTYGDKAGLYAAAFEHYNRTVLDRRLRRHAPPCAGIQGLRSLFLSLLDEPMGESFGCLITNAAVEFGGGEAVPPAVGAGLHALEHTFIERLRSAKEDGLLNDDIDPLAEATKLLALYQGVLVLVRQGWGKTALASAIGSEFDRLGERNNDA